MTVRWLTAFLDRPRAAFGPGRSFWSAATGSALSPPRGPGGRFATFLPPDGDPFLRIQRIDAGSPACHLDLHVDDVPAAAREAAALGATVVAEEPGLTVLRSPAGLPFCLVDIGGEAVRPTAVAWPGGHHSLVDQVCLDVPSPAARAEGAFWSALTGWERRAASRPEFGYLERPADQPLRLLIQRLDDDRTPAGMHLDFATDDVGAEVARHRSLGATVERTTEHWTTLRDPAGQPYCVTARPPATDRPAQGDPRGTPDQAVA